MKILQMTAMVLGLLAMQAALAHTELAATVPEDKATIEKAPKDLQLTFSEPVRLTALTLQLDGAPKQSLGPLPAATTEDFAIALPALTDGHYVVTWRALSEDTHVMNGEFMFAIGAEAVPAAAPTVATPDAHSAH
jgi:methionine-rich copper-binding protein CopC